MWKEVIKYNIDDLETITVRSYNSKKNILQIY